MRRWLFLLVIGFLGPCHGRALTSLREDPNFVGRSQELAELREKLREHKRVAVVGVGGIGKTSLAFDYACRWQGDYDAIFWLDPKGNIAASLKELAAHLNVPTGKRSLSMIVDSIKQQLNITTSRFLLIFDSMPDDPLQLSFLPSPKGRSVCHVLITSRWNKLSQEEIVMELGPLKREESAVLLAQSSKGVYPSPEEARPIAALLEDFPLAIKQAGAYLAQLGHEPATYIQRLRDAEENACWGERYAKSLAATGLLSMEEVQKKSPTARQVLAISSLINGNNIPISLIEKMVHPKNLVNEALEALGAYSLISPEEETFSVHRFFQRMVLASLGEKELGECLRDSLHFFNYRFNYAHEQVQKDPQLEETYPHLKALLERPYARRFEPALTARLLGKMGCYELWEQDAYHAALEHLREALEIQEDLLKAREHKNRKVKRNYPPFLGEVDHIQADCAALHFAIGTALQHLEQNLEAKEHFEASVSMFNMVERARQTAHRPGRFGRAIASNFHGLARVAYDTGDLALSKKLFKKALAINKAFYNTEERFFIARDIHWLGCIFAGEGDFSQAIDLLNRSLEINGKLFSTDLPPYSGATLCELGRVYMDLGRFGEAIEHLERAVRAEEKYHGAVGSPHCAKAHHLLARQYLFLGQFDQADRHLHEALLMRMILFGTEEHPKVLETLRLMGQLCLERGDWRLARSYLDKVYRINRNVPVVRCKGLTETLVSLGDCAMLTSDLDEAKSFYEQALKVHSSNCYANPSHLDIGIELMLGHINYELGDYSDAFYYLRRAKKGSSALFSTKNHLHIAHADRTLGRIAVQQTEYAKAKDYYNKALETYRKLYKTMKHPCVAELLLEIAELNYKTGDYEEAFDLCERACEINRVVFNNDPNNLFLADILNWQGRIAYREGKFNEALGFLNQAKKIVDYNFPGKPAVARGMADHFIADVLSALGKYEEAYQAGNSARTEFIKIYKKPAHSNIADTNIALAKVCIPLEKYNEASLLLNQTLSIVNQLNPKSVDHRKSHIYFWLGSLEQALGNYKQAETFFRKEYYILSAIHKLNPNHPYIGMAYLKLADCLVHQGNKEAARYYYEKGLAVQEKTGFVFKHQDFVDGARHLQPKLNP